MIITIHQPEFMPYLGFFHKMNLSEKMVLLDTVQFKKNNFQNRNRINVNGKPNWLSLPIEKHSLSTIIKNIKINNKIFRAEKHLKTIKQYYSKHQYFSELYPLIEKIYTKNHIFLSDFNNEFILMMKNKLNIKTELILSSEMSLSGNSKGGTEVTLEISKLLNSDIYISGSGGKTYMNTKLFDKSNIKVVFQEYKHPNYSQLNTTDFIPYLSVIDLYFNHGQNSLNIIMQDNLKSLQND